MTDSERFHEAVLRAGAELKDSIGIPEGADEFPLLLQPNGDRVVVVEFWQFGDVPCVVLITAAGKVGVYRFVGQDGEPIERDIERARAWCKVQERA